MRPAEVAAKRAESFPKVLPTAPKADTPVAPPLILTARIGAEFWAQWDELRRTAAVIGTALVFALRPSCWDRAAVREFARQILAVGIAPMAFVCALGLFVGISVIVQLSFWAGEAGQSQLVGPLILTVVARELAPVLINLVVIVRSGSAMTTELGVLKVDGEMAALEARGGDPFRHLVMPRVLAVALSTFCLTTVFILVTFASGFVFAAWTGKGSADLTLFANNVCNAIQPRDVLNIVVKSVLPALFAGASWCLGGLGAGKDVEEIPAATERALTRSVGGLFVISVVVSLLTYY